MMRGLAVREELADVSKPPIEVSFTVCLYTLEYPRCFLQFLALSTIPSSSGHTFSSRPLGTVMLKALICNYFTDITLKKFKVCLNMPSIPDFSEFLLRESQLSM